MPRVVNVHPDGTGFFYWLKNKVCSEVILYCKGRMSRLSMELRELIASWK